MNFPLTLAALKQEKEHVANVNVSTTTVSMSYLVIHLFVQTYNLIPILNGQFLRFKNTKPTKLLQ